MFLAYQGNSIYLVANSREEIEKVPCMKFTKIEETNEPVEMVNGAYYVGEESIKEAQIKDVRKYRNYLLETEIDQIVSNPLHWTDLSNYDQEKYKEYRRYLLDYTEKENWWKSKPKTFDEYCDEDEEVTLDLSGTSLSNAEPVDIEEE